MPVTDPFTVACPSCGTHFAFTKSSVEVDFAVFSAATAGCPSCGIAVPIGGERAPRRRAAAGRGGRRASRRGSGDYTTPR